MKKLFILVVLLVGTSLFAQNFQLHYDFDSDRKYFTGTLEMFKPDDYGSTFWFVDFDLNDGVENQSAAMAYWEILRMFKIPGVKGLSAGLQYNDGLNTFGGFGNVWLVGAEYPIDLKFITLVTSLWYRDAEAQDVNFQGTIVWFKPFFNFKLIFTGFFDIWGQNNFDFDAQGTDAQWVILTEPQLWYSVTKNIAVGGEVEISKNFVFGAGDELKIYPTVGFKWTF
ncbi:MAG: DUF5020 family protein [Candidatus Marinimicrobia bacterium]|nr:DUF5020 family protein [Candidatus Neomarinimicrobiota bacterium]